MRTFRITLSHGSERITFDGAGARSGSMFHVRRDAIEGLWSSPASKVSLTERETANGASPISDGETLYAARTVSIPFAIQSNYNHTDLIRARTLLGRLLGWHDVRMDVNDDGDETVLYGYVEAKYSDIPYDHADTGTITLVCPDPRRMSKHESIVTMNTSSNSIGGLGFGVLDYVKSWTGTANASASILSQDGQVVATNSYTDPNALVQRSLYNCTATQVGSNWRYTSTSSSVSAITGSIMHELPVGTVIYYKISADDGIQTLLQNATLLKQNNSGERWWSVSAVADHAIFFVGNGSGGSGVGQSITLEKFAQYTPQDYSALQSFGITWFDGDSQSPQPNAGLVFPLNFGQSGNTGNTGMITNNGSYVAMPTITAHGNLDSGLTIHWTTSDGHEGDLSFNGNVGNVPVTINTDTHSAIMGGLDVSYLLSSRDWPRIPAGGSCSFALLASGNGWVTVQSHDTYM